MKYEKAYANIVNFENKDIIATSTTPEENYNNDLICAQPSWDADHCDGVTQAVSKGQF